MKTIVLSEAETVEVSLQSDGTRLYISASEKEGFQVIADRNILIEPRMDNSIRIIPQKRELRKKP